MIENIDVMGSPCLPKVTAGPAIARWQGKVRKRR